MNYNGNITLLLCVSLNIHSLCAVNHEILRIRYYLLSGSVKMCRVATLQLGTGASTHQQGSSALYIWRKYLPSLYNSCKEVPSLLLASGVWIEYALWSTARSYVTTPYSWWVSMAASRLLFIVSRTTSFLVGGADIRSVYHIYLFISNYFHAVLWICVPAQFYHNVCMTNFWWASGSTFAADNLSGNRHFILSRV